MCTDFRSLRQISEVFSLNSRELGTCTTIQITLPLQPGTVPIDRPPCRVIPHTQEIIDKCFKVFEDDCIVGRQASPYGSPVTLVSNHDGSPWLCVDYRNAVVDKFLVRESWPMSHIESPFDAMSGVKFISIFDVQSAYHQIPGAPADQRKTAFVTSHGK